MSARPSASSSKSLRRSFGAVDTDAPAPRSPAASIAASLLRQLCGGRDFGGVGDLAHDLDDVAVRVEDTQLPVGAVPVAQHLLDSLQLALRAELPGVRPELLQRPFDRLDDRDAVAAAG